LNSAVLTGPGTYRYALITREEARAWLLAAPSHSQVGYPATAQHIRDISGLQVGLSREPTRMEADDEAIVVRLKYRLTDPRQKATYQPKADDWEYGLLVRLA